MENRTRERVGLVIFIVLVLFGGTVLTSYFATGLSWTVAATFVDDTVGRLNGYTAVVYSGILPNTENVAKEDQSQSTSDTIEEYHGESVQEETLSDSMGLRILSFFPVLASDKYEGVYVSDARDLYEKKGASVATVDLSKTDPYEDPIVIDTLGKKVGVYSLTYYATKNQIAKIIQDLEDDGADVIVGVMPSAEMLSTFEGTDVVLLTRDYSDIKNGGIRIDNTLVIEAPKTGEVGVLLFSNSNVASTRIIDAL